MKKLLLVLVISAFSYSLLAQSEDVIIPQRSVAVLDNFTACPNLSLGHYQYARQVVLDALSHRRLDVYDVEQDGIGRADIVYPSFNFARSNDGNPYDINRALYILDTYKDARYYVTMYISKCGGKAVDHESKDKNGDIQVRTDFSAFIETELYVYDIDAGTRWNTIHWRIENNGNRDPEEAQRRVVSDLGSKVRSMVINNFRFKASVIRLGEYNKKGKLQDLYLSCGSNINVERGDIFYVYAVSDINGISSAKKLGKVKVKEITGPESCRCSVSNGEAEINTAYLNGETVIAVSDSDTWF